MPSWLFTSAHTCTNQNRPAIVAHSLTKYKEYCFKQQSFREQSYTLSFTTFQQFRHPTHPLTASRQESNNREEMFPVFVRSADWGASMIHNAVRGMCYLQRAASDTTQYTHRDTLWPHWSPSALRALNTPVWHIQQCCQPFFLQKCSCSKTMLFYHKIKC